MTHWENLLRINWGIDAKLSKLDGEYDLNLLAITSGPDDYVVKIMRPNCEASLVEMQVEAISHLYSVDQSLPMPALVQTLNGEPFTCLTDENGASRLVWVLKKMRGQCYAKQGPKSLKLVREVGSVLGRVAKALHSFDHPHLTREFKWDLLQADWIASELDHIEDQERRLILADIHRDFADLKPELDALPKQAVHNDANDYNILVDGPLGHPVMTGLIDFGDMCMSPRICDLSIAAAYLVLDQPNPEYVLASLVAGYHAEYPLNSQELDLLWPLLRMRLAVSVVNSTIMATANPNDPYVAISQAPAWRFLEKFQLDASWIAIRLKSACDLPPVAGADKVLAWLNQERGNFAPLMGRDLSDLPMGSLSVENSTWPQNPFDLPIEEAARVGEEFGKNAQDWIGYYNEPRLIYASEGFRKGPWKASDRRTVHTAVDVFAPAGRPLFTPLRGEVLVAEYREPHLDYGGVVILRHETPTGEQFYTLYGHLDPDSFQALQPGDIVEKGQEFCRLGDPSQNGGWVPHVHFQLALCSIGDDGNWPGVADPDELYLWRAIYPNPAALLNLPDSKVCYQPENQSQIADDRQDMFVGNLALSYDKPIMLVRGWKHHVFDQWGRPYLDAYNNVPHVGHAHPRIQAVAADQLKRINTNTRYLHSAQTNFAAKILSKLPEQFQVCFFVNSGSEANELALRLAREHTGAKGMITPDHGYHGNTTGAIDISAYKFAKPGGVGQADWVELIDVADDFRGRFRRGDPDCGQKFANLVDPAIAALGQRGHRVAGLIAETFPSVGGQIVPPKGYLSAVYQKVRAAGGVCIADEVQTGLGRLGKFYFGFEQQKAMPDIVVLGKPIGNGHPIGVVVTTRAIAESFNNGIEFFSTFGGSTLSCRIGHEVLDIIDDEGLAKNAQTMGDKLLGGLNHLKSKYGAVGDVRGIGLFIGVELVNQDGSEATELCKFVTNRMRDRRILIGAEGPKDNILKIRPPLTIEAEDVDMILWALDRTLAEASRNF